MRRGGRFAAGVTAILFAAVVCAADPERSAAATLRLQLIGSASLDASEIDLARAVARSLLAPAVRSVEWSELSTRIGCTGGSEGVRTIRVLLTPGVSATRSEVSGTAIRDVSTGSSVIVYLRAAEDRARSIRMGPPGRSNPLLARLQVGHLIGLTIAHEVGHVLNLRHSASGIMQPYIDVDDVLALREGRLAFTRAEEARMRTALERPCRFPVR